ncbi:MAG TPA: YceI family protein [Solimonas sp.]|nr:YceI family protein [Solimonas sp.]
MSIRRLLPAALCVLLPAVASADQYVIETHHTYPSLEMSHMGISIWRGKFNKSSGKVTLDRKAKTGTVDIAVETASVDFGHDEMNKHAVAEDWLNAARYPVMNYKGQLKFSGDTPSTIDGQLTMRGVTRPVTLKINSFTCIDHPFYKKEVCGADAEGQLDRADFGMTQYTDNGAGKITIKVQVEAIREG